jgi:membrane fusion protein, multidrug efflux system
MENVIATTPAKKKFKPAYIILPLIAIIIGYFAYTRWQQALHFETTDNAQIESNAVPVLSRIAGYVDSLHIKDYQAVKASDVLLVLDSREYAIAVQQATADLLQAKADLSTARAATVNVGAGKQVALANTSVQQTKLDKAKEDLNRDQALFADGAITKKQLEDTRANLATAQKLLYANQEQTKQASVQNNSTAAQVQKALALIATREAALEQAKLKLSFTKITAPVSGKIGRRNLEIGQYVQPGQPLFTIVNNEVFWVIANFKETQLGRLKIGQPATIEIDGFPDTPIKGKITGFSDATGAKFSLLPADNASGNFVKITQRIPVKIEFDNTPAIHPLLKAGLSVKVQVQVQ